MKLSTNELNNLIDVQENFVKCLRDAADRIERNKQHMIERSEPEYLAYSVNEIANLSNNLRVDMAVSRLIFIADRREANAERKEQNNGS